MDNMELVGDKAVGTRLFGSFGHGVKLTRQAVQGTLLDFLKMQEAEI